MKISTIAANVAVATLFLIAIGGCRKKYERPPVIKPCLLSTVTSVATGNVESFFYDDHNRLSLVHSGYESFLYEYGTNTKTITERDAGTFVSRTHVTMNGAGLATNVKVETIEDGSTFSNTRYEYDGEQLTRSTLTFSWDTDSVITTYTWSNGNVVSAKEGVGVARPFEYYTDKLRQDGDILQLTQTVSGYEIYRTRNLVKAFDNGTFIYSFDTKGKIRSVNIVSGENNDSSVYNYGYQCD